MVRDQVKTPSLARHHIHTVDRPDTIRFRSRSLGSFHPRAVCPLGFNVIRTWDISYVRGVTRGSKGVLDINIRVLQGAETVFEVCTTIGRPLASENTQFELLKVYPEALHKLKKRLLACKPTWLHSSRCQTMFFSTQKLDDTC